MPLLLLFKVEMTSLEKYITEFKRTSPTVWAKKNGISPMVLSRYFSGKDLSFRNLLKIEKATEKFVTVDDLVRQSPGIERVS